MNIWIAIFGFFASGITCFAIGIRISTWGFQSREEEWRKAYKYQTDIWTTQFEEIRDLYCTLTATASETSINHPKAITLRNELDEAFSNLQALHVLPPARD